MTLTDRLGGRAAILRGVTDTFRFLSRHPHPSHGEGNARADYAAFLRERGDRAFRLCVKTYEELEEESLPGHSALGFDLLLNATSVGMVPKAGVSPVSRQARSASLSFLDYTKNSDWRTSPLGPPRRDMSL